jgi:hypothetical protein
VHFLTGEESRQWARRHGFNVNDAFGHPVAGEVAGSLRFQIPADAGARVALARALWESAGQDAGEVLVWVTECGVWPSGQHMPLAEAARRGLGAEHSLDDRPGHLVRLGERDAGLSILCLAMLFLWDCWLLPSDSRPAVFVSHDEYGMVAPSGNDGGLEGLLRSRGVLTDRAPGT